MADPNALDNTEKGDGTNKGGDGGSSSSGNDNSGFKMPAGYRFVKDDEVIPPGYTTRVNNEAGTKITNAPPPSSSPAPTIPQKPATPAPEPKVLEKIVDVNEKPKEKPTSFSFMDNNQIEKDIVKPTPGDQKVGSSQADLVDKLRNAGASPPPPSSPTSSFLKEPIEEGDFAENADFLIDGVAFLLSSLFRWYSLDTTETPYEFKEAKITKLKGQLARILKKKQKAFPLEWACVGTLLAMCITPATKAYENRKLVLSERALMEQEKKDNPATAGASPRGSSRRGRGQPAK